MIHYKEGNLLEAPVSAMLQSCNCYNTMGGGIALQIARKYPEAAHIDSLTKPGDENKLGKFTKAKTTDGKVVYNVYGQYDLGGGVRRTNYEALYSGLEYAVGDMNSNDIKTAGLPHFIGCALGGGDWRIVEKLIEVAFENYDGDLYIYKFNPYKKK